MQRSISHNKSLNPLIYILVFVVYISLSSVYLFLPPLLGLLFFLFSRAIDRADSLSVLWISFALLLFEANFGYALFSSIIYFYIVKKFFMPSLEQSFYCGGCIKISYILFAYIGYFLFLLLLGNIFMLETPKLNYYIIYYIVIEFFLVSLL